MEQPRSLIYDHRLVLNLELVQAQHGHLIMKRGFRAYGMNEVLAQYRVVSSSNTASKHKAALEVWDVYRKVERLSFFKSGWYFVHYLFHAIRKRL